MPNVILAPRNVVTLFNNKLTNEFIRLSEIINKQIKSKIFLNKTNALPHISVYSTNFPVYNLPQVEKRLNKFVRKLKPFSILISSKVIDMKTIFLNVEANPTLQKLHNSLVDLLNNLREGLYDEKELDLIGTSEERRRSLLTYGMWAAKELYIPHISLARPYDSSLCNKALKLIPDKMHYEFVVDSISLVERGHDGTCKKVIQTYKFINSSTAFGLPQM